MVPWSLERKHTYRQYQLKSSYALWVTKIMPHFILLHNWTRISWHVLFIFLFCWLKTVFLLNDTIWGPECTFFKEPKTVYSHPKRVCWITVTQRDVLPDDRHSRVRCPSRWPSLWSEISWVRSIVFWILFDPLFWVLSFLSGKLPQGTSSMRVKEGRLWKRACQNMSSFWCYSWQPVFYEILKTQVFQKLCVNTSFPWLLAFRVTDENSAVSLSLIQF